MLFGRIYLFAAPGLPALSRPRIFEIEDGKNTPTTQEKTLKNAAMTRMPRNISNPVPRTFRKSIGTTSCRHFTASAGRLQVRGTFYPEEKKRRKPPR